MDARPEQIGINIRRKAESFIYLLTYPTTHAPRAIIRAVGFEALFFEFEEW
tara:strand:- start:570 stop:722 length:153 start_codon:yes stop_codon:yes gene_type:complete